MASNVPEPKASSGGFKDRIHHELKTDPILIQARSLATSCTKSLPSATTEYLLDKVPVVRWLPRYSTKWFVNDLLAGTTIGLLLIPQSLAYARIANIPGEYGLMSSWIPPLVGLFVLTGQIDLCPGPTSIIGVLVAEVIQDFKNEGFSPERISGVLTFLTGIIALSVGILRLGFILDFISLPVLSGFVSAAGFLTILSQIPALFGNSAGAKTSEKVRDMFVKLPMAKPYDTLVGFSCILILVLIEQAGKRWGKKNKVIWILSTCRNAIVIVLFTLISFGINKDLETPKFELSKISAAKIETPRLPPTSLFRRLFFRSITIFVATALEHLAIGKTYGRRHGYKVDESQELVFLGISNLLNGFFPTMAGGGSISRSAVSADSGVKTPLSGIFTSGFVLLSLYFLTGALYWIPKATLSAVIITAVYSLLVGPSTFYSYWRVSLPDFIASMIAFWVTLFVSIEMGVALAVAFSVLHTLLRLAFSQVTTVKVQELSNMYPTSSGLSPALTSAMSENTLIFAFKQPIFFLNAERIKAALLNSINQQRSCIPSDHSRSTSEHSITRRERLWCESKNSSSETLTQERTSASLSDVPSSPLIIILDFTHVFSIDTTGIQALLDVQREIHAQAGPGIQWRLVSVQQHVRLRLERSGCNLQDVGVEDWDMSILEETENGAPIAVFENMHRAVLGLRNK
ncbi:BgTH12-01683 [Blumeria graminis f. sp. triticale]|uniref:BgTH12-01683 n=1 Tax=Blumeria graminis f. sp. triticale TaxID=1689686 RepID=A0A9W4DKE7_BLUGR|nr:High affinity sulfate permease [Blumeria graminis f. sp. tritici 96224]CAD6501431.1 BgTH12-01683 [Blumeria graminis f. sp. triticale]